MSQFLTHKPRLANLFPALALLALPACTVGPWERDFWHPPAAAGIAPITEGQAYPVTRAAGELAGWPNLGDVPPRTEAPITRRAAQSELERLAADRQAARAEDAALREGRPSGTVDTSGAIAVPDAPPVPPPETGE